MAAKKQPSQMKKIFDTQLKKILNADDGIYAVILSSIDGHPVSVHVTNKFDGSKLSAMTSSCIALGEKIAVEANQKGCDFVIIQNQDGFLALKRVGKSLVITSLAHKSINLGMLLTHTRIAAGELEAAGGI